MKRGCLLLVPGLLGACVPRVVTFTAANTPVPVLLGATDGRRHADGGDACDVTKLREEQVFGVERAHSTIYSGHSTNERKDAPGVVDLVILSSTRGDKGTDVCVDALETSDVGAFWVLGIMEKLSVSMELHPEPRTRAASSTSTTAESRR